MMVIIIHRGSSLNTPIQTFFPNNTATFQINSDPENIMEHSQPPNLYTESDAAGEFQSNQARKKFIIHIFLYFSIL